MTTRIYLPARCKNIEHAIKIIYPNEVAIDLERNMLIFKDEKGNVHDITSDEAAIEAAKILIGRSMDVVKAKYELLNKSLK